MLGVEDHLPIETHRVSDRVLDHREVFVVRGLQHGRDLPCVALADERPHRSVALRERLQVGVVLAASARAPGRAESRQACVFERFLGQPREELFVLGVGAGEPALDIVEAEPVEQSRDPLLVGGRE